MPIITLDVHSPKKNMIVDIGKPIKIAACVYSSLATSQKIFQLRLQHIEEKLDITLGDYMFWMYLGHRSRLCWHPTKIHNVDHHGCSAFEGSPAISGSIQRRTVLVVPIVLSH